jgi:heat shock protein HslJ
MQRITILGFVLGSLLLAGCLSTRASLWGRIGAHKWQLIRIEDQPPLPGSDLTLQLEDPNQLFGTSGVNRYFGSFQESGTNGFHALQIAGTRMAGPRELMDQETRFLELLGRADSVELEEQDGLRLLLLEGTRVLLTFAPQT